jgi:cellulose synthase/poly-beta-1,6-N-acetylglucosamine synthase-like glycosyltransferase
MTEGTLAEAPFRLAIYAVASTLVLADTLDLLIRLFFRRVHAPAARGGERSGETSVPLDVGHFTPYQMRLHLRPFAILASVHNLSDRAETFVSRLGTLREHLWIIDDASTDDTVQQLDRLRVRHVRGTPNRKKPGAIRELLARLPPEIVTIVIVDPDVEIDGDAGGAGPSNLERVLFEFQRSGMAAACPRIVVRPDGLWADFQYLEYSMALEIGRKGLGDHALTSGASIYRRDALERALSLHSLSVYAEDLSNALILLSVDERIYYDGRLVVATDGKRSLGSLFSQRVGWAFGLIQIYLRDFQRILQATAARPFLIYHFVVYTGLIGLVLHPLRVAGLAILGVSLANGIDNVAGLSWIPDTRWTNPLYMPLAYLQYTLLTVAQMLLVLKKAELRRVARVVPLYFFYAVLQTVPTTLGYLNWFGLRFFGRRVYRDHYQADEALMRRQMAAAG